MKVTFNTNVVNKVYRPYLRSYDKRINVFYGGAGSGKSHFVVQKLLLKAMIYPGRRILVIRKVQNTLRDSIFRLFSDILSSWGMLSSCRVNKSNLEIELPNGSLFLFKGLDDPEKIKSIAGIDDIIVEEATELTLDDFSQLNLRLRSRSPYNQIHLMFNPISKANWVYSRWFKDGYKAKGNEFILHTTYKDNEYLRESYIQDLEQQKEINYAHYLVYALGEFATRDKLVYPEVFIDNFNHLDMVRENGKLRSLYGLDFGYSHDPTAFIALLLDEKKKEIYIYDEIYERGMLNNDIANALITKGYRKVNIVADSASPKDIDELRVNHGIQRIQGAKKGPGSILNGIQFLQQYRIYVHPDCVNTIEEFKNYAWSKDKSGEYINKPIDAHNHLMDALRYAVEEINGESIKIKILDKRLLGF